MEWFQLLETSAGDRKLHRADGIVANYVFHFAAILQTSMINGGFYRWDGIIIDIIIITTEFCDQPRLMHAGEKVIFFRLAEFYYFGLNGMGDVLMKP